MPPRKKKELFETLPSTRVFWEIRLQKFFCSRSWNMSRKTVWVGMKRHPNNYLDDSVQVKVLCHSKFGAGTPLLSLFMWNTFFAEINFIFEQDHLRKFSKNFSTRTLPHSEKRFTLIGWNVIFFFLYFYPMAKKKGNM